MDWIRSHVLSLAMGALPVGAIAFLVVQFAKRVHDGIDSLPTYLKAGAVFVCSTALSAGAAYLHVPLDCAAGTDCLAAVDTPTAGLLIQGALGSIAALLLHAGKSGNPNT